MPTIRENILEDIRTTLADITTANGFNNTIVSVQRWLQRGNDITLVPCIVISSGPEDKQPAPNPLMTCKLAIYLDVYTRQAESDTQATETILHSLLGDIEKALMADYTRSGLAQETNFRGNTLFQAVEGSPHVGIIIELEIIYQHNQDDPEQYL